MRVIKYPLDFLKRSWFHVAVLFLLAFSVANKACRAMK